MARPGRPSNYRIVEDLAVQMWAPVFQKLSEEDRINLSTLPYDEALYRGDNDPSTEILATYNVRPDQLNPADEIQWMTTDQIHELHDRMIKDYGGDLGRRLPHRMDPIPGYLDRAANSTVMGHDPFPTLFEKAAFLFRTICTEHPYADGQKRTGLAVAFVLLGLNGYALWSRHQTEEVHYAMEVARGMHEVDAISDWLKARVGPLVIGRGNAGIVRMLGGPSGARIQPRCRGCGRYLRSVGFHSLCPEKCRLAYEVRARAVALATGRQGDHIEARIGLHKVGEQVEFNDATHVYSFVVTAGDEASRLQRLLTSNGEPTVTVSPGATRVTFRRGPPADEEE